jgi:hypothetical protein
VNVEVRARARHRSTVFDPSFRALTFGPQLIQKVAPMPDANLLSLARDFRARAEEILARAETMHDADTRWKMREVAAGYEKLAQRVEQRSGEADGA